MAMRRGARTISTARRLLSESGPARAYLIANFLLGLVLTGLIVAQAAFLAHCLATAAAGVGPAALRFALVGLLLVVILRAAAAQGSEVTALRAAAHVKERLRGRLTRHALELGPAWLGRQRDGEITALATTGLDSLDPYFARYLPQLLLTAAAPAAVLVVVGSADWLSAVIIAVTLPVVPAFAVLIGLHTKAQTRRNWQLLARLSGHFLDVVQGLPTLKVLGRAAAQEKVISRLTGEYRRSVMSTLRVAFMSALVLELSAALATALVAVEVGIRLLYGHIGYSTALLVLLLTPEAYLPLRNASAQFHSSADGLAAAGRAFEILDTAAPARALPDCGQVSLDLRSQSIMLNVVSAAYPGSQAPVLDRVELRISPGDQITIAGVNGAGKTSLLRLLLRFIEPAAGSLEIAGTDVASIPVAQWRAQIGWLPQHPALFPWSIAENIALGNSGANRRAIERAARLAGADRFISELPGGYDTILDERALRLSAGQRQKIALARVFLRDAPLILLDEPTAHLDPQSAAEIETAIRVQLAGRTVITVTHRTGGPCAAGRLLVVAGGTITELAPAPAGAAVPI
jgi:ATP-binding cassette subfamily C protein CydD